MSPAGAGVSDSPGASPFPFCLHASPGVENGCSWAELVQPPGLQSWGGRGGGALRTHKPQAAGCTLHLLNPCSLAPKIQRAFVEDWAWEGGGSSRARLEEAGHNWVGAAEVCLQPGRIGLWGPEPGRIRGEGPSCWDVRASCFFLPAVG